LDSKIGFYSQAYLAPQKHKPNKSTCKTNFSQPFSAINNTLEPVIMEVMWQKLLRQALLNEKS
jgi:hypothetical protein